MSAYPPGIPSPSIERSGTVLWVEFGSRPAPVDPGPKPLTSVIPLRPGFGEPDPDPDAA